VRFASHLEGGEGEEKVSAEVAELRAKKEADKF
jgi:hypothetical protein